MQQRPDLSEARKALLQKYLRGEIAPVAPTTPMLQPPPSESPSDEGVRDRAIPIQTGITAGANNRPFFFLHGDWTGNAFFCYNLARGLGSDQPFYILDTYNFEPYSELPDLKTIAAEQVKLIRAVQPEGPYQIGGFCNGGLIAYEMARQLHAYGQKVDVLVLMDSIPPRYAKVRRAIEYVSSLLHLAKAQQLALFLRLQHVYRFLVDRQSEDYAFIKTFDSRIDSLFPPLETLRKEFPAMFIWATALYEPDFYAGKVTLFWDKAEPIRRSWWHSMAKGKDQRVEVHIIPGSHASCKTDQIDGMAKHLLSCLTEARSATREADEALK